MALDMTVNSNPLLNINVGEYGRYCLKTIYHIGTVVLYVIKNVIMQQRGLWNVGKWVTCNSKVHPVASHEGAEGE